MDITVSQVKGRVPVTVLKTSGSIDGLNYEDLIEKARIAIEAGTRDILLDLTDTDYMSTAGMIAIQSINRLLRGESPANTEGGWDAIHQLAREDGVPKQAHLKLLNPSERVRKSMEAIGFTSYFQIFSDRDEAVKAF